MADKTSDEKRKKFEEALERLRNTPASGELFRDPIKAPPEIAGSVIVEDPADIQIARYLLTDTARNIFQKIDTMSAVADEMRGKKIKFLNAALLYGESGTGKTQFCRYVAHEMELPFVLINLATIRSSYIGGTNQTLDRIFAFVRKTPCVFVMDELDSLAARRGSESGWSSANESDRIVTALIQLLDRLPNEVIIMAATNRDDILDEAIVRRFRIREEFKKLTSEEAMRMAFDYLTDCKIEFTDDVLKMFAGSTWNPSTVENIITDSIAEHLITKEPFRLIMPERLKGEANG